MPAPSVATGVVHAVPQDMKAALTSDPAVLEQWNSLTPLARNEWICWTTIVKKEETRKQHIERMKEDLLGGKRRPCCWIGCIHRKDKSLSPSQVFILGRRSKKAQ